MSPERFGFLPSILSIGMFPLLLFPNFVIKPMAMAALLYPCGVRIFRFWGIILVIKAALFPLTLIFMKSGSYLLPSSPGIAGYYVYLLAFRPVIFGFAEAALLFLIFKGNLLRQPNAPAISFRYTLLAVLLGEFTGEFVNKLILLRFDLDSVAYAAGLALLGLVLFLSQKHMVLHASYRKALTTIVVLTAVVGMVQHMLPGSALRGIGESRRGTGRSADESDCKLSDEEAIRISKDLLRIFDIEYNTAPITDTSSLSNVDYPGIRALKTVRYEYPDRRMKGRFYIGCESKEVEQFENFEGRQHNKNGDGLIDYRKAIELAAGRLRIPDDVVFSKIEHDSRDGVWNGIFIRELGGYKFEWDRVIVGVSESGAPAYYKKIYKGSPCALKVSVQREEALRVAKGQAQNSLPPAQRDKMDELYKLSRAELLIVDPDRPHYLSVGEIDRLPKLKRQSRLAWIVVYSFTGGPWSSLDGRQFEELSAPERAAYERTLGERHMMEHKLNVPGHLQVRIDAENGNIIASR